MKGTCFDCCDYPVMLTHCKDCNHLKCYKCMIFDNEGINCKKCRYGSYDDIKLFFVIYIIIFIIVFILLILYTS